MRNSITLFTICLSMRQEYRGNKSDLMTNFLDIPSTCQMYDSGTIWNRHPDIEISGYHDKIANM